jgi:glycosidase
LDFAFRRAVIDAVARHGPTSGLARLFEADSLYEGGEATARRLPTFVSNHDAGRFGWIVRRENPRANDAEVLARVTLAYAMLLTLRGVPVVYYGDEQGFAGDGGDMGARQDMFASQVAKDNALPLIGTGGSTAVAHFGTDHPLYREIAELAALRRDHVALRRGAQLVRAYGDEPGLFVVSRIDPASGAEILAAFNTADAPVTQNVQVDARTRGFASLHGACPPAPSAPGSARLSLAALAFVICAVDNVK